MTECNVFSMEVENGMPRPEISVIIPVYNLSRFIKPCILSVVNQTFKKFEMILVNDGSEDDSGEICEQFSERYPNILVIHQMNAGVSEARNAGIRAARGRYIAFLDGDDEIKDNFLEVLYGMLQENRAELACLNWSLGDSASEKTVLLSSQSALDFIWDSNKYQGYVWNKLFLRELIIENKLYFDPEARICEDLEFCVRYIKCSSQAVYKNVCLNIYRSRKDSAMGAYDYVKERNRIAVLERLKSEQTGDCTFNKKLCRELIHSHIRAIFWESRESSQRGRSIAEAHLNAMSGYFSIKLIRGKMKAAYYGVRYFPETILQFYKVLQMIKRKRHLPEETGQEKERV